MIIINIIILYFRHTHTHARAHACTHTHTHTHRRFPPNGYPANFNKQAVHKIVTLKRIAQIVQRPNLAATFDDNSSTLDNSSDEGDAAY